MKDLRVYFAGSAARCPVDDKVIAKKKNIFILFAVVALVGGSLLLRSAQPADKSLPAENTQADKKMQDSRKVGSQPVDEEVFNPRTNDDNVNFAGGEFFLKMMLSILMVVVLGAIAIYFSKKLLPRISKSSAKEIHIVETAYIGSRKAVHLIRIGNQQLLIGSTGESITMLADVTYGLSEDAAFTEMTGKNIDGFVGG